MNELLVMFFANGTTAVFCNGKQQPNLQKSWIVLFAEFLESKGIDPLECEFEMSDGSVARLYRTSEGSNWRIREH